MRLIKFRAWHKKWNFMFNINQIDWDKKLIWSEDMPVFSTHSGWEIKDGLSCINHEKKTVRLDWCPFDLVKSLDQFTGLFDKNGKEIFEGDIVRFRHESTYGIDCEVQEVKWCDSTTGFMPFATYHHYADANYEGYYMAEDKNADFVVIGNIYENPELLKNS